MISPEREAVLMAGAAVPEMLQWFERPRPAGPSFDLDMWLRAPENALNWSRYFEDRGALGLAVAFIAISRMMRSRITAGGDR